MVARYSFPVTIGGYGVYSPETIVMCTDDDPLDNEHPSVDEAQLIVAAINALPELLAGYEKWHEFKECGVMEAIAGYHAGKELAEAVEKSQEYDHDMLEYSYTLVAKAIATYRESIKGV
jgi:hypothetical protein